MDTMTKISLGFSAALGGFIASLSDLLQKGVASAIVTMSLAVETHLQIYFPSIIAVLVIVALGVCLCFVFEADTKQKAFYVGASVLAILMTLVPYRPPASLQMSPELPLESSLLQTSPWLAVYDPGLSFAQLRNIKQSVGIRIHLTTDDGKAISKAVVTVRDSWDRSVVGQSILENEEFEIFVNPGQYVVTMQVPGYLIEYRRVEVKQGKPLSLEIPLRATLIPLPLQRLF